MNRPLVFKPVQGYPDLSPEIVLLMKDYLLSVRYFMEESIPVYEEMLISNGDFELLDQGYIHEVSRLKDGGYLDLRVEFFLSREDEVPFCVVGPTPAFLAEVNYEPLKRREEA